MRTDCRAVRTVLAEGALCKAEACECGTVHLSFGPVTLRLRPEAVESIWATLGQALRALHGRSEAMPDDDARASKTLLS